MEALLYNALAGCQQAEFAKYAPDLFVLTEKKCQFLGKFSSFELPHSLKERVGREIRLQANYREILKIYTKMIAERCAGSKKDLIDGRASGILIKKGARFCSHCRNTISPQNKLASELGKHSTFVIFASCGHVICAQCQITCKPRSRGQDDQRVLCKVCSMKDEK